MTIWERNEYINKLKKMLPYPDKWYTYLKDAQIYVIYQKYSTGVAKVRPEQLKGEPKVYIKKRNRICPGQLSLDLEGMK